MRATAGDTIASPSSKNSLSFRGFSVALSLRRHQVASLESSSEEEFKLLDLLHSRLTDSLQSLLPSFSLSLPSLHKLLDAFLASKSDFNSLLLTVISRNPSLISRDRAVPDFLDRVVKSLDLCNAVSFSLHSLRHWTRYADIAAFALQCAQFNRARRALSKLLVSATTGLNASSSSCRRFFFTKKHLQVVASSLATLRNGESGSASVLSIAVCTISTLLHFSMWVLVASFPCGSGEIQSPPLIPNGIRHMPWALALSLLHEKIGENVKRETKEGGLLEETLAVERSAREVFEMASNEEEVEELAVKLAIASQKLEEGLGPFERKVREVFHRLVWCREEVIRCLGERSGCSSLSSVDSV